MPPVVSTAIRPTSQQTRVAERARRRPISVSAALHRSICVSALESVLKAHPRIVSASLSQSAAVEETVLLAASQNITAYAVNTEASQG